MPQVKFAANSVLKLIILEPMYVYVYCVWNDMTSRRNQWVS
jgi:hypothetical protein